MADLLDARGRPVRSSPKKTGDTTSPLERLLSYGVRQSAEGDVTVSKEVLERLQRERLRGVAFSATPSTPRWVQRDAGGVGVRKGHGQFEILSNESLRHIRERAAILQAIHSARHHQVRRMSKKWDGQLGEVGWRVVHRDFARADADQPDSIVPYIKRFERMMERPSQRYCKTTAQLLTQLEEDLLTINRPCVEVIHSALEPGRVVGWRAVDGALIWPTFHYLEKWVNEHPSWQGWDPNSLSQLDVAELASEAVQADLVTAEYCLVRDGVLESVYRPGKILCEPVHNRTDINRAGYPPSHVEQAVEIVLSFINAWDFNGNYFTRGMLAEFILGISGNVHDADLDAFVDMFRESTQGVRKAWQPPIMPLPEKGAIEKIDLRQTNREMMFEIWLSLLVALCSAVYRMDPSIVNAKPWDGGGGSSLSEASRFDEIELSKEEGLQSDLQHFADTILTPLAQRCHPDLIVVFEYGNYDAQQQATTHEINLRTATTYNEVRLAEGRMPRGFWVPDDEYDDLSEEDRAKYDSNPWNYPGNTVYQQAVSQAAQLEQQKELFGPGGGEMPPGMPPEEGNDFGSPPAFGAAPGGEDAAPGAGAPPNLPPGGLAQPPPGMEPPGRELEKGVRIYLVED